ncbi:MAG: tetratricopeptide repeat protein, partial [Polyangiaceae bacterium]
GQTEAMDLAAAATAHGPLEAEHARQTNAPAAIAADKASEAQGGLKEDDELALRAASKSKGGVDPGNALGPGGGGGSGGGMLGAAASAAPPTSQAQGAPAATTAPDPNGAFANAMAAYRAKNYDEATRGFDALAANGDDNSALWAARSVRESSGCGAAVNRFDQLEGRAFGTQPGYDATFESGECYKAMGSFDAARLRFSRLLTVPTHAARAQAELNKMSPSPYQASPKRVAPAPAQQMNQSAY